MRFKLTVAVLLVALGSSSALAQRGKTAPPTPRSAVVAPTKASLTRVTPNLPKQRLGSTSRLLQIQHIERGQAIWWGSLAGTSGTIDLAGPLEGARVNVARRDWGNNQGATATGDTPADPRALETLERVNAVRDAIATLPIDLSEALVIFEYERMSYAEIATAVDATPKAVENRIARARERLRARLRTWAN